MSGNDLNRMRQFKEKANKIKKLTINIKKTLAIETRHERIKRRDQLFSFFFEITELLAQSTETWIKNRVLLKYRVPMLCSEVEKIRFEMEKAGFERLLDQLQGETQSDDLRLMPDQSIFQFLVKIARNANIPRNARSRLRIPEGELTRTLGRDQQNRPGLVSAVESEENDALPDYVWGVEPFSFVAVEELEVYGKFCELDVPSKLVILLDRITNDTIEAFDLAAARCGIDPKDIKPHRDRLKAKIDVNPNRRRLARTEIAAILGISQPTFRSHLEKAYSRLGLDRPE